MLFAGASLGRPELGVGIIATLSQLDRDPVPSGPYGRTMNTVVSGLVLYGQRDLARELLARLERSARDSETDEPLFDLWVSLARTQVALYMENDLGLSLKHALHAKGLLDRVRDPLAETIQAATHGRILLEIGSVDEAILLCASAAEHAARLGSAVIGVWAGTTHCNALCMAGRHEEARRRAHALVARAAEADAGFANIALAHVLLLAGDHAEAETRARAAMAASPALRMVQLSGHAVAGASAFALGKHEQALRDADEGLILHDVAGGVPRDVSLLLLTRARALAELGRRDEALISVRLATERFDKLAEGIDDERLRNLFRERTYLRSETSELLARLIRA
jgi:tetratricopeptide (TPR) repeat protein